MQETRIKWSLQGEEETIGLTKMHCCVTSHTDCSRQARVSIRYTSSGCYWTEGERADPPAILAKLYNTLEQGALEHRLPGYPHNWDILPVCERRRSSNHEQPWCKSRGVMGWLFPRRTNKRERRSTVSEIIVPVTSPDPLGGMQPEMAGQQQSHVGTYPCVLAMDGISKPERSKKRWTRTQRASLSTSMSDPKDCKGKPHWAKCS
jgi:hypothetical protein